jgi:hypothetical protein
MLQFKRCNLYMVRQACYERVGAVTSQHEPASVLSPLTLKPPFALSSPHGGRVEGSVALLRGLLESCLHGFAQFLASPHCQRYPVGDERRRVSQRKQIAGHD